MSAAASSLPVLVVGAGIMGAGIAQVAAQAGHPVFLHDLREGAADQAKLQLAKSLQGLVAKGKLTQEAVDAALARIQPIRALQDAATAALAVEAIVEQLPAKRSLFAQLEELLPAQAILATNTSSISVTAIANGLKHPERLVGMHFFNPVPLMKLVEVVSGLQTAPEVAERIVELSRQWGKVPVHAKSTPGFIVNRIARPYYAESLALLQEQAATPWLASCEAGRPSLRRSCAPSTCRPTQSSSRRVKVQPADCRACASRSASAPRPTTSTATACGIGGRASSSATGAASTAAPST